ncbi:MAG: alpha/beta fold hydrolase, partial [Ferruginibacter sp.]
MQIYRYLALTALFMLNIHVSFCQDNNYPYPLNYFNVEVEHIASRMAYMDVNPAIANGKTIVLFHGKNFDGYYWKEVIPFLSGLGYRVIVPDQLGFGESDKPNIHYSFHQMAANSKALMDTLHIEKLILLGHSMGGMLAARFALMYPSHTEKLILENPIGLEDYK